MADVDANYSEVGYYEAEANGCICADAVEEVPSIMPSPSIKIAPTISPLGTDLDVVDDLRASFVLCSGYRNLGNAIARRLDTPAGALAEIGDDPDYGRDVKSLLNEDMTEDQIRSEAAAIEQECMKDERVQSADVTFVYTLATYTLGLDINLETAEGPYRLVLGIGELSVDVLDFGLVQESAI